MLRTSPLVQLVELELLILSEHLSSPPVLVRFLLLLDIFRVVFLSFCPLSFGHCLCLSYFDLRILITPLVSSNSSNFRVCI